MTVLSAQSVRRRRLVEPCVNRQQHEESGCSFGLSACGYDIRLDQDLELWPGQFRLASAMEEFRMHNDVVGIVHDKSTWARRGLSVFNTVIEPGWRGFLTLELKLQTTMDRAPDGWPEPLRLVRGTPIAQVVFHLLDEATESPYSGKYQNQERGPVPARDGRGHR